LVLLAIAGVGGIIDTVSGGQARGGFNWGIVIASAVAILSVRRSGMFPVVIAPPIVYALGSGGMLYIRSGGLHDRRVLFDGAANWLVYGFPAIATASACVLIIAGIRMIARR
jgi:fumarate reductase subunit D